MRAYVLVSTAPQTARDVTRGARRIKGVTRADCTRGPYDLVCLIEGLNKEALYQIALNGIRGIEGVTGMYTCFVEEDR
jgi:uncharacterized protein with GYD domain